MIREGGMKREGKEESSKVWRLTGRHEIEKNRMRCNVKDQMRRKGMEWMRRNVK